MEFKFLEIINRLFLRIAEDFKTQTNCKTNYIEYISSLLYLKYRIPIQFETLYRERNKPYLDCFIDDLLKELRCVEENTILFSNIRFQDIKTIKPIQKEKILVSIIEILYSLEDRFQYSDEETKKLVAMAYENLIETCISKNDIVMDTDTTYTPKFLTDLLVRLVVDTKGTFYNPYCNSGNFLISAFEKVYQMVADEQGTFFYNLCMTNLYLHSCNNATINTFYEIGNFHQQYDYIVANSPFSKRNWIEDMECEDASIIQDAGLPSTAFGDYAFVIHMLTFLKESGTMGVILPHGTLFRKNEEYVRKYLIKEEYVDAIIGLPENLFYHTRISVIILILSKCKKNRGVLFIDASHKYRSGKGTNYLTEEMVQEIIDVYKSRKNEENMSTRHGTT